MQLSKASRTWLYLKLAPHPGKIPELDGIRAIAIILVLFRHFIIAYNDTGHLKIVISPDSMFLNIFKNGWLGVDLFFILSGYLITRHIISLRNNAAYHSITKFYVKRVLRTFPLYYCIILLILFGAIPYYNMHGKIDSYELISHALFLQDYHGTNILITLWSLATEEKFYLISPLILLLIRKLPYKKVILYFIITIILLLVLKLYFLSLENNLNYSGYFWLFRAPFHFAIIAIFIGVIVAFLAPEEAKKKANKNKLTLPCVILVILTLLVICNWGAQTQWWITSCAVLLITIFFGYIIYYSIQNTSSKELMILRSSTLRKISVLSYSLYLTHFTILPLVNNLMERSGLTSGFQHLLTYFCIYIMTSVLFSLLLHFLIEKPFLMLKDKI